MFRFIHLGALQLYTVDVEELLHRGEGWLLNKPAEVAVFWGTISSLTLGEKVEHVKRTLSELRLDDVRDAHVRPV